MLAIRLQRTGRNKEATYRIVVARKSDPVKKKFIEVVGHYLPARSPVEFIYRKDRIEHWINNGANPSNTLARLLKKDGVGGMDQFIEKYSKKRKRKTAGALPNGQTSIVSAIPGASGETV